MTLDTYQNHKIKVVGFFMCILHNTTDVVKVSNCNHGELSSLTWLTNDASRHQF